MTTETTNYKLVQVGFGTIGEIYSGHLMKANGQLILYDIDRERLEQLAPEQTELADSPRQVAEASEIIILALPSPEAVKSVVFGEDGILKGGQPGSLILDISTIDPLTSQQVDQGARENGISYLEAPVSGGEPMSAGTDGARKANITFICGGAQEAFERARPILNILGSHWFLLGPAGAGSTVKLISNLMSGLNNLVAAEGFVLGAAAGIPWQKLIEVFRHTDAKSFQMTDYMEPRMIRKDFEPGFSTDLMYKDHRLAGDLALQLKVPLPLNSIAVQVYQMLRASGRGKTDFTEALNLMGEWAGVDVFNPRPTFFLNEDDSETGGESSLKQE